MGVVATFFVCGEQVRAHPSVASDVVAAGHEIAGGEILMLHDADRYAVPFSWRRTLVALPEVINEIRGADFEFRPIG